MILSASILRQISTVTVLKVMLNITLSVQILLVIFGILEVI